MINRCMHLLAVCLIVWNFIILPPAIAGTLRVKSEGASKQLLTGDAETRRVGSFKQDEPTKVVVTNNVVDVLFSGVDLTSKNIPEDKTALKGMAFLVKSKTSGRHAKISGYAFFDKGKSISTIDPGGANDTVTLKDGTTYSGRIAHASSEEVRIKTDSGMQTVRPSSIDDISSPRVFEFQVAGKADGSIESKDSFSISARKIKFSKTYTKRSRTSSGGAQKAGGPKEPMPTNRKIALLVIAGLVIATAIAVPLAVAIPLANRRRGGGPAAMPAPVPAPAPAAAPAAPVDPPPIP